MKYYPSAKPNAVIFILTGASFLASLILLSLSRHFHCFSPLSPVEIWFKHQVYTSSKFVRGWRKGTHTSARLCAKLPFHWILTAALWEQVHYPPPTIEPLRSVWVPWKDLSLRRQPEFWLSHFLAVWPWESHSTSLSFRVFIVKWGW